MFFRRPDCCLLRMGSRLSTLRCSCPSFPGAGAAVRSQVAGTALSGPRVRASYIVSSRVMRRSRSTALDKSSNECSEESGLYIGSMVTSNNVLSQWLEVLHLLAIAVLRYLGIWSFPQLTQDHTPIVLKGLDMASFESDALQVVSVVHQVGCRT